MKQPSMRWVVAGAAVGIAAAALLLGGDRTAAQAAAPKKLLLLTHNTFYKHDSLGPAERATACTCC